MKIYFRSIDGVFQDVDSEFADERINQILKYKELEILDEISRNLRDIAEILNIIQGRLK